MPDAARRAGRPDGAAGARPRHRHARAALEHVRAAGRRRRRRAGGGRGGGHAARRRPGRHHGAVRAPGGGAGGRRGGGSPCARLGCRVRALPALGGRAGWRPRSPAAAGAARGRGAGAALRCRPALSRPRRRRAGDAAGGRPRHARRTSSTTRSACSCTASAATASRRASRWRRCTPAARPTWMRWPRASRSATRRPSGSRCCWETSMPELPEVETVRRGLVEGAGRARAGRRRHPRRPPDGAGRSDGGRPRAAGRGRDRRRAARQVPGRRARRRAHAGLPPAHDRVVPSRHGADRAPAPAGGVRAGRRHLAALQRPAAVRHDAADRGRAGWRTTGAAGSGRSRWTATGRRSSCARRCGDARRR